MAAIVFKPFGRGRVALALSPAGGEKMAGRPDEALSPGVRGDRRNAELAIPANPVYITLKFLIVR